MRKKGIFIIVFDLLLLLVVLVVVGINYRKNDTGKSSQPDQTLTSDEHKTSSKPTAKPATAKPATTKPTNTPSTAQSKDTVLTFTGDVLLTDYMVNNYKRAGIKGLLDDKLYDLLTNADINMINEEFPFSKRGAPMKNKEYTFRTSPEYVSIFKDMGVDIVTLANNHGLDYGTDALMDTFTTLDDANIKYVGAGKNLDRAKQIEYFEVNGHKIAFIGASRVLPVVEWYATSSRPGMLSTYDPTVTCELIREAKTQADYVVVYVHWGVEHTEKPVAYQRNMGKQYINSGADIVVGTHTHCLQGVEFYKDKPIVYSLGNFIFSRKTTDTAMIKLVIDSEGKLNLAIYPCKAVKGLTSMVTDEKKVKEFNQYMESISFDVRIDENHFLRLSD